MADPAQDDPARPPTPEPAGRCVVLSPPGGALLGLLLPALTGRWHSVSVVADEPGVMEELAGTGVSTLVVVEPDRWTRLGQLTDAVDHYYPRVVCMAYQIEPGGDAPRIASLKPERSMADVDSSTMPVEPAPSPAVSPPLGTAAAVAAEVAADARQQAGLAPEPSATCESDSAPRQGNPPGQNGTTPRANGVYAIPGPATVPPTARRQRVDQLAVRVDAPPTTEDDPHEALITEDELTMLLGPGPGEVA